VSARLFPERRGEALNGILRRTLDRHRLSRKIGRHLSPAAWQDAVGPELAGRAQPTVLSCGTLHLLVADHRWRDQIDAARALIIARVNQRLGCNAVRELQFGLAHEGALPGARPVAAGAPSAVACDANLSLELRGATRLSDELREAIVRAANAASRARRPV
jgi:predicted nucleic acid-binding Zn ribbon protein